MANFDACDYEVVFAPDTFTLLEITGGEINGQSIPIVATDEISPGRVKVVENVTAAPGVTGSGYLAELRFHVMGHAGQTSAIGLENGTLGDNEANEMPATWKGAHIDVIYRGDVNGDGVVNALDITRIELIVSGKLDPTPSADVNGDGSINALDITKTELLVATASD